MKVIWALIGLLALALALIGVILPLLPTVPFLLVAAFCFARSSPRLHDWLLGHKILGPMIIAWNTSGSISLSAKRYATLSILVVFSISIFIGKIKFFVVMVVRMFFKSSMLPMMSMWMIFKKILNFV